MCARSNRFDCVCELACRAGRKTQRVDRAVIGLQIVRAAQHRFAGSDKLIRDRYAVEPAVEWFLLALNEARQKPEFEILIAIVRAQQCVVPASTTSLRMVR